MILFNKMSLIYRNAKATHRVAGCNTIDFYSGNCSVWKPIFLVFFHTREIVLFRDSKIDFLFLFSNYRLESSYFSSLAFLFRFKVTMTEWTNSHRTWTMREIYAKTKWKLFRIPNTKRWYSVEWQWRNLALNTEWRITKSKTIKILIMLVTQFTRKVAKLSIDLIVTK